MVQDASVNLLVSGASVYHLLVPDASIYHSVSDPYHLAGSGPVSDDTDPDPGSAKTYKSHKKIVLKILFTRRKKSIFCYISDYIVNVVYLKKDCKTFNREHKIHRVKNSSDPD